MGKTIKLRKGYDIKLVGTAPSFSLTLSQSDLFAVKPTDFIGTTPRLLVEQGDEIKAGDPLFHDKKDESILFTSPVSGEIVEVVRGARRVIQEIRILADKNISYKEFGSLSAEDSTAEQIKTRLLESGAWTLIRQRPYNRVPQTNLTPNNIFISGFDSAPYGFDFEFALQGTQSYIQAAVNALQKLTEGKIFVGLSVAQKGSSIWESIQGIQINYFEGKHPAGNVGVQIHHTAPINKGDTVWTIDPQNVVAIGRIMTDGKYNTERYFSVSGAEFKKKGYFKSFLGTSIKSVVADNLSNDHVRFISGNPLTGDKIMADGFIGTYHNVVCVIEEGDEAELFGWLLPSYPRPSLSRTFPGFALPEAQYKVNTNMHGEERAFVVTGAYEQVLPMDVLPMQLFKACLANDIDNMEALGIYEVVEEDIALCEFICTSKLPLQEILREALNYLENEA